MPADSPFTSHDQDTIPLNRNVAPIPECRVAPVLQNGKVVKAVDVPILGCASVWLRCQREAERWISDCDGSVMRTRPDLVNARINAAYAYLWLTDHRFQWAGLAAFASKQVGCGLLHSAEMAARGKTNRVGLDRAAPTGAAYMKQQLAIGNRSLFLNIYPLHRFYTLRGIKGMRSCQPERQLIQDKVQWDVRPNLPFGQAFPEILAGFEAIERGDILESVRQLARHEQINVLQKILYNDPGTRALLDGNQAAWVIGFPSGFYEEVQLTLSAQCKPKQALTSFFKKSLAVKLYDPDDRMAFVYRAAEDFDKLVRKHPADVERSMREILMGHGIRQRGPRTDCVHVGALRGAVARKGCLVLRFDAVEALVWLRLLPWISIAKLRANCQLCDGRPMLANEKNNATLPETGFVRQSQLVGKKGAPGIIPFSPATLWRKVAAGQFPAPVKLSAGVTAWRVEEVRAWLAAPR